MVALKLGLFQGHTKNYIYGLIYIPVSSEPGSKVQGNMQIRGGSGNDVNFNIKTNECKRNVDFSFTFCLGESNIISRQMTKIKYA